MDLNTMLFFTLPQCLPSTVKSISHELPPSPVSCPYSAPREKRLLVLPTSTPHAVYVLSVNDPGRWAPSWLPSHLGPGQG